MATLGETGERHKPYIETFDEGPGGWMCHPCERLPVWDGVAYCHGPWLIDANHAPPGAGYLHLLMYLHTKREHCPYLLGKANHFADGGFTRDMTNAKLTLRLRGLAELRGANLMLLVQSEGDDNTWPRVNYVLSGQPISITEQWSEQTITLAPDPAQWTYLGVRHDLTRYGYKPIDHVLRDVSVDLILVLFPLSIHPLVPVQDIHRQWAGKDYPVDYAKLPQGLVMVDTVRIDYP